jgi:alpha-L-fucosidase
MKVNGSAIYATRPRAPYAEQEIRYTGLIDGTINAIYLARKEDDLLPSVVEIPSFCPVQGATVRMLGLSTPLIWEARGKGCLIKIPDTARKNPPCKYAWTFRFAPR